MDFFRFPRTPHLAWLGTGRPRDDKVLSARELAEMLASEVVVEEKVDGANVGLSIGEHGTLRAQNRGSYLSPDTSHPQFKPLFRWLAARRDRLVEALSSNLMLFGEWCYAVHSVRYTKLGDWFLAFDVYDRTRREFWSAARRDALVRQLDLEHVPRLTAGRFDLQGIVRLLGTSRLGEGPAEGVYVRRDAGARLVTRAKLVRPEFTASIGRHWSRRVVTTNALAVRGRDEGSRRRSIRSMERSLGTLDARARAIACCNAIMMDLTPEKVLIFRITHVNNVPWILDNGVHCRNSAVCDPGYREIGNRDLIARRVHRVVPVPPGGTLSDYVPFYFTPCSPMLYNLETGYGGIEQIPMAEIAILVSSLHRVKEGAIEFVFTDRHAYLQAATFSSSLDDLGRLDWKRFQARDFRRAPDDPGKMERYQAEALIHGFLPVDALTELACFSPAPRDSLEAEVRRRGLALKVVARPEWYF